MESLKENEDIDDEKESSQQQRDEFADKLLTLYVASFALTNEQTIDGQQHLEELISRQSGLSVEYVVFRL